MTILEKIKFEEDWLSTVNLTKENVKIALDGIRATALEQQQNITNEEMYQQLIHLEAENERLHDALESQPQFYIPCIDCNTKMNGVYRAHDNLSKQRWIPVNEPPKKNGEYLVILIDEDSNSDDIFVVDKAYWTGMNWTYKFLMVENVIAWMSLPESYAEREV